MTLNDQPVCRRCLKPLTLEAGAAADEFALRLAKIDLLCDDCFFELETPARPAAAMAPQQITSSVRPVRATHPDP